MNHYTFPGIAIDGNKIPTNHPPFVGDSVLMPSGRVLIANNRVTARTLYENGAKTLLKMNELQNKEVIDFRYRAFNSYKR